MVLLLRESMEKSQLLAAFNAFQNHLDSQIVALNSTLKECMTSVVSRFAQLQIHPTSPGFQAPSSSNLTPQSQNTDLSPTFDELLKKLEIAMSVSAIPKSDVGLVISTEPPPSFEPLLGPQPTTPTQPSFEDLQEKIDLAMPVAEDVRLDTPTEFLSNTPPPSEPLFGTQYLAFEGELVIDLCRTLVITVPLLRFPMRNITVRSEKAEGHFPTPASRCPVPVPPCGWKIGRTEIVLSIFYGRAVSTWIEEPPGFFVLVQECINKKLSFEEMEYCPVCNIDLGCVSMEKLRLNHILQDARGLHYQLPECLLSPSLNITSSRDKSEEDIPTPALRSPVLARPRCLQWFLYGRAIFTWTEEPSDSLFMCLDSDNLKELKLSHKVVKFRVDLPNLISVLGRPIGQQKSCRSNESRGEEVIKSHTSIYNLLYCGSLTSLQLSLFSLSGRMSSVFWKIGDGTARFKTASVCSSAVNLLMFLGQKLILQGCEPLPRRRCFDKIIPKVRLQTFIISLWNNVSEKIYSWSGLSCKNFACLNFKKLNRDCGGCFKARMAEKNVNVVTASLNIDASFNEFIAARGLFSWYFSLDYRFPIYDNVFDLVRVANGLDVESRPEKKEFLMFDINHFLLTGGLFWIDNYYSSSDDNKRVLNRLTEQFGCKNFKCALVEVARFDLELVKLYQHMNSEKLHQFISYNRKAHVTLREGILVTLQAVKDSASLVLDSLKGFSGSNVPNTQAKKDSNLVSLHRTWIMLMKCFYSLKLCLAEDSVSNIASYCDKKRVTSIAEEWKPKLDYLDVDASSGNSLESHAFLQLLATIGNHSDFDHDSSSKLVCLVSHLIKHVFVQATLFLQESRGSYHLEGKVVLKVWGNDTPTGSELNSGQQPIDETRAAQVILTQQPIKEDPAHHNELDQTGPIAGSNRPIRAPAKQNDYVAG